MQGILAESPNDAFTGDNTAKCWISMHATKNLSLSASTLTEFAGCSLSSSQDSYLGRGGQSFVRRASISSKDSQKKTSVALKITEEREAHANQILTTYLEEQQMRLPAIVPALATIHNHKHIILVLPIFEFTLQQAIPCFHQLIETMPAFHEKLVFGFFASMVSALITLEKANLIHRDIKPGNIALSTEFDNTQTYIGWQLFDFGLTEMETRSKQYEGSIHYSPPETLAYNHSVQKSDTWAIGQILFEIMRSLEKEKQHSWAIDYAKKIDEAIEDTTITAIKYIFFSPGSHSDFLTEFEKKKNFKESILFVAEKMHDPLHENRPNATELQYCLEKLKKYIVPTTEEEFHFFVNEIRKYHEAQKRPVDVFDFDSDDEYSQSL